MPRRKPFHKCQKHLCPRLTMSGKPEKDASKRWCHHHLPANVSARVSVMTSGVRKACSAMHAFRNAYCRPRRVSRALLRAFDGGACSGSGATCMIQGVRAFDPWLAWKRFRCKWPRQGFLKVQASSRYGRFRGSHAVQA